MNSTKSRKGAARSTFERLIVLVVALSEPQGASITELSNRFEVSTKTLHRDMDFVRDRLMIHAEYDHASLRWRATGDVAHIRGIKTLFANL